MILIEGMYIFGGLKEDSSINDKLYILSLTNVYENQNKMCLKWKSCDELDIKGKPPTGRYDHEMKKLKNTILVYGGRKINREKPFCESIFLLQLSSLTWVKV